MQGNGIEVWKS